MPYKNRKKQNDYQLKRYHRLRQAWFDENGPCAQCGSNENLEVDHIDPSKKITHTLWSRSKAFREKELSKCQVLCHSCHKEKTLKDQHIAAQLKHGKTTTMYRNGCRCEACRAIHAQKAREYYEKRNKI